jgi:hypothetical protein
MALLYFGSLFETLDYTTQPRATAPQVAEPEQAPSGVQQAEPDKLVDGAGGELAQRSNLIG